MFCNVKIGDDLNENDINYILKKLYDTNFFQDVSIKFNSNNLLNLIFNVIRPRIQENINLLSYKNDYHAFESTFILMSVVGCKNLHHKPFNGVLLF